jgi:ABC-type multidrug transport system ATPase subunit
LFLQIAVLLEELGLGSVRKSLVSTLTSSERQRLVVACQLITGAEILCLDDATHGMDIFDTFFLVSFEKFNP